MVSTGSLGHKSVTECLRLLDGPLLVSDVQEDSASHDAVESPGFTTVVTLRMLPLPSPILTCLVATAVHTFGTGELQGERAPFGGASAPLFFTRHFTPLRQRLLDSS
jgi:hypothetical protein